MTGFNPAKAPIKFADEGRALSERARNRNEASAIFGPSAGLIQDVGAVAGIAKSAAEGQDLTQGQKAAMERLLPFNSYFGVRQLLRYVIAEPSQ
jgi:hypothetical protein